MNDLNMFKFYSLTVIFVFLCVHAKAQISFANHTNLVSDTTFFTYLTKGVVDINNDGLDDIIRTRPVLTNSTGALMVAYQQPNGTFIQDSVGSVSQSAQLSTVIGDIDRNGFNDIITGGYFDGVHVMMNNNGVFTLNNLVTPSVFVQGTNLADIDNDGWLDYFVCNDEDISQIWANDGAGVLSPVNNWINLHTIPISDNSGNYGSVWTDFDNDGDIDLYIAKCRAGVNSPTDPRRINQLYVNNGNGTYTENAAVYGLADGNQSWTADFQDIDNDGDMDCFITNHQGAASRILENDGTGHFTDITATTGLNGLGNPYQGLMVDFDNDGFVDILVSGSVQKLFRNNGNKTFTEVLGVFDNNLMRSFAIGDLNNDGFQDVYASYWFFQMPPHGLNDKVWINDGASGNHHINFRLKGTQSNINGIGARVTIYYNHGNKQIREIRAGESYGIANTFTAHFGIGANTTIDSATVWWPSGHLQQISTLSIDSSHLIIEVFLAIPTANNDTFNIFEDDMTATFNILANDSDFNGNINSSSIAILLPPQHAQQIVLNANGTLGYTPVANFNGIDSIEYVICDSTFLCDTAWVYFNIESRNDFPIAMPDTFLMTFNQTISIATIFQNDSDIYDLPYSGGIDTTSFRVLAVQDGIVNTANLEYTGPQNTTLQTTVEYEICDNDPILRLCDTSQIVFMIAPPSLHSNTHRITLRNHQSRTFPISTWYDNELPGMLTTITSLELPTHSNISINSQHLMLQSLSVGKDTLLIKLVDQYGWVDSTFVFVDILPKNDTLHFDVYAAVDTFCFGAAVAELPTGTWTAYTSNLLQVTLLNSHLMDSCVIVAGSLINSLNEQLLLTNCAIGYCDTTVFFFNNIGSYHTAIEMLPESKAIKVYQAVSPNGDSKNDYLHIDGISRFPRSEVMIFDSGGNLVFEKIGYLNLSEGGGQGDCFDGKGLNVGIYYWVIRSPNGSILTGYFVLN
jgi:gliding motility-associated-like protein